jgi:hypothetical protein
MTEHDAPPGAPSDDPEFEGPEPDAGELAAALSQTDEAMAEGWTPRAGVADALAFQLEQADRLRERGYDPNRIPAKDWAAVLRGQVAAPADAVLEGRRRPLSVVSAGAFLEEEDLHAPALIGTDRDALLTSGGLLIMGGEGGASKTTLTLDAVAHLASGTDWLGWPVPEPVRILMIENEGPRAKFRQKMAEKAEAWEGGDWLSNVLVYRDPWGLADFSDPSFRAELRAIVEETEVSVVAADPLDSLGVIGVGAPDETRQFIAWLKDLGLTRDLAFWILHHYGKGHQRSQLAQLSGAWGAHPDAVLGVSLEGKGRTRLDYVKLRWADTPGDGRLVLQWTEGRGFRSVDRVPEVSDAELWQRLHEFLGEQEDAVSSAAVRRSVKGANDRLVNLLRDGAEAGLVENLGTEARPKWKLATFTGENTPEPDADANAPYPPTARSNAPSDLDGATQRDNDIPF